MPAVPLYSATVQANGTDITIFNPDGFSSLPTFTLAGFTLTAPGSPTFPTDTLVYGISPTVYQGQAMPVAVIDSNLVDTVNDSALSAAAVVVGSQGANGLTNSLLNRAAYVGATTGSGTTTSATLAAVPTGAPQSGAVLFANTALGEAPREFTRSGTALAVSPALPSAPAAAAVVLIGNR